ncbi:squalene/phytoene synthase family protein [Salinarimonas rosea]|uniref:squalene/phytoene synthase family protein n=1 Tax=Salinarimonas rosea TaxID=552063 RepID=UPI00040422B6|nr:squalene/phytoene synthase family protein [Salinarimonas rosea]
MSIAAAPAPTKTHRDENFPVASRLIARPLRAPVLAFYRFARAADDVADDPAAAPQEKLARLAGMERALRAGDPAEPVAAALHAADRRFGAGVEEALALLDAFRQDAVKSRYGDWAELLAYCRRSADPVGRFLLRLHGEDAAAQAPADALCSALQILNHLQDLEKDRAALDRVYLPGPWMEEAGGEAAFFAPANSSGRRPILDAALDRVDDLLARAASLPERVRSRRLAAESALTLALARRLAAKLRAGDPVATRIALGKRDVAAAVTGLPGALARRHGSSDPRVVKEIVAVSGSSFKLGMAAQATERRRANYALYAFCRVIDDIADGAAPLPEKRAFLDAWRREIDALPAAPTGPIGRELARAMKACDLPRDEFHALLDGMESDACKRVRIPDAAAFDLYCRRVAGAVGVLSVRIFGAPGAHDFALVLGRTLQVVNVLRDVDEDAAIDRVYVPLDRLAALGIADGDAPEMVAHPRFAEACAALAEEARAGFAQADRMLAALDRRALRPAIVMMEGYRLLFAKLGARGFAHPRGPRLRLTKPEKARLVLRAMRLPGGAR